MVTIKALIVKFMFYSHQDSLWRDDGPDAIPFNFFDCARLVEICVEVLGRVECLCE